MSYKQNRTLKVYEQSGYKDKTIPTIMLKGQWLAELNFQIGDNIFVSCDEGKLVITKTELQQNNYKRRAEVEFPLHVLIYANKKRFAKAKRLQELLLHVADELLFI